MKTFKAQSQEWLDWRKQYITGTEVAVLFGLNPYKKPKDLYEDKFGTPLPFETTSFIKIGRLLEPTIISYLGATPAGASEDTVSVLMDEKARVSVSLDGMLGSFPLECKCMFYNSFSKKYGGRVPDHYLLQLLMQMRLVGKNVGYFGVLLYVPEEAVKLIEQKRFSPNFSIFPLIIESIELYKVKCSFKKLHKLIDSEVSRFWSAPKEFKVSKDAKKELKEYLDSIDIEHVVREVF